MNYNRLKTLISAIALLILFNLLALFPQDKESQSELELVADKLEFPEGPAWDGVNTLYASKCYGDWITKIEGGTNTVLVKAPSKPYKFGKTNGLTVFKDGSIFACDYGNGTILRFTPEGECYEYVKGYKFNRPNDLAFDSEGNLYFTDPKSYDPEKPDGVVYKIDNESKEVLLVADSLAFPNGIALWPRESKIYVCESAKERIIEFNVDSDGRLFERRIFCELPEGDPDGIAFDEKGILYVAHFGTGNVFKISRRGNIVGVIEVPGSKPTNLEFGDEDMKTLYITEVETNSIYKLRVKTPGMRLLSSPSK